MNSNKVDTNILTVESIKPLVNIKDVENILFDRYGLKVTEIKELNGYDDKNFFVKTQQKVSSEHIKEVCENGYVFKVINTLDSEKIEFFNAQDSVLVYLNNRGICCPKVVKTKKGKYLDVIELEKGKHIFRLLEFIPGKILADVTGSPLLFQECGVSIAQLNKTIQGFHHEGYVNRDTPWMLENVPKLKEFLFAVKDIEKLKIVNEVIEAFTTRVLTVSHKFEKVIIHGDFNEQNILVELGEDKKWHVKGVLDFGDSHIACFLFDLAITMTYVILHAQDIDAGGYVLAGSNSLIRLPQEQIELLKVCICARMCQSLVMGAFTLSRDPTNTYVTRTAKAGWTILENLWKIPDDEILKRWLDIGAERRLDDS